MNAQKPTDTSITAAAAPRLSGTAIALIIKGCAILALALASVFVIFALVPDGNDYALASVLKHHRLQSAPGHRVVLLGGSNLAFGVDSSLLEDRTGCAVVNMGMNGYLGVQFMLEEARPHLRRGDIAVIALEYDSYFKSVKGTPTDLLMIAKANPRAFSYLDWEQKRDAVAAIPYVAQQKVLRLIREGVKFMWTELLGQTREERDIQIDSIEVLAGFTAHGDLTSHLNVPWPYEREDGVNMDKVPLDPDVIPMLRDFTKDMNAAGITVLVSYTSVIREYYQRYSRKMEELDLALRTTSPLVVPSEPIDYVYDEHLFFDTVYHLNAAGRALRSEELAADILGQFKDHAPCGAPGTR